MPDPVHMIMFIHNEGGLSIGDEALSHISIGNETLPHDGAPRASRPTNALIPSVDTEECGNVEKENAHTEHKGE